MIQVMWVQVEGAMLDIELQDISQGVGKLQQDGTALKGLEQDLGSKHKALVLLPDNCL